MTELGILLLYLSTIIMVIVAVYAWYVEDRNRKLYAVLSLFVIVVVCGITW